MATANQIDLSTGRQIAISTVTNAAAPTDRVTTPTITLGPQSATQLKTTGMLMFFVSPPAGNAVPNAGGFNIIPWFQNPATGNWAAGATVTVDYRQAFADFEFDAIPIYLQIDPASVTTNGIIWWEVMEQ